MPNVFVQSCSGEKSKILGHAALRFTFQGENGKTVSFIHDVLITDFVQHPLLVGRDFTGSQAKLMETNSHLYLSDNPNSSYDSQEDLNSQNVADVPIGKGIEPPIILVGKRQQRARKSPGAR